MGGVPAPAGRNGSARAEGVTLKAILRFHAGSRRKPPEAETPAAEEARLAMSANNMSDPRRPNKVLRYKPPPSECNPALDDPTPDYMNLLGMIFSMCGLMLKLKWCAWVAVYCSFISFANSRSSEDTKQMMSSFMLSISAVVMSYLQNPQPMTPPW
ncbi:PAT complex subunit Asterix [Physeter macrocephalus]|nr:PAT complex subunit Asterix [Physeter catodon]|eukprot:XP_007103642.2 protein Asterix [Physeter catodon]